MIGEFTASEMATLSTRRLSAEQLRLAANVAVANADNAERALHEYVALAMLRHGWPESPVVVRPDGTIWTDEAIPK